MIDGIKGISRRQRATYRLVIGEPPRGRNDGPKKLDHFELRRKTGGQYWEHVPQFAGAKRVRIVLMSDDTTRLFRARYVAFDARSQRVRCEGNGETAVRFSPDYESSKEIECNPQACTIYQKFYRNESSRKLCGPVVRLQFMLPGWGVCEFRSGAFSSTGELQAGLESLIEITSGLLAGLPCDLVVAPGRVGKQADGKPRTGMIVSIEPPSWAEIETHLRARGITARTMVGEGGALPIMEGDDEFPEEFERGSWDGGDDGAGNTVDPTTGEVTETRQAAPLPATWEPPAEQAGPSISDVLAEVGDPDSDWR